MHIKAHVMMASTDVLVQSNRENIPVLAAKLSDATATELLWKKNRQVTDKTKAAAQ